MQHVKIPKIIIVGAGPGGLTLYHALIKNKDKKEFDVKIFERDSGPKGTKYHFMIRNELFFFSTYHVIINFELFLLKKNRSMARI